MTPSDLTLRVMAQVWDANFRCRQTIQAHTDSVTSLVVCGEHLFSSSRENRIKVHANAGLTVVYFAMLSNSSVRCVVLCYVTCLAGVRFIEQKTLTLTLKHTHNKEGALAIHSTVLTHSDLCVDFVSATAIIIIILINVLVARRFERSRGSSGYQGEVVQGA